MDDVLLISTGGTIVSSDRGEGFVPDKGAARGVLSLAEELLNEKGHCSGICSVFGDAGVDSSDMSPENWELITEKIYEAADRGVKKFLVIHGTDTMAYTAAWLSLTAPADVSVALTGSQRTQGARDFDGADNLRGAVDSLFSGRSGVFIHFAGRDYDGAYVHKEDASGLAAYVSAGSGRPRPFVRRGIKNIGGWRTAADQIGLIHLHPAALPHFTRHRIMILEGYGSGNMPGRIHSMLCDAYGAEAEKPVIIAASSCALGRKSASSYGGVGIAGLAKKNFHVFDQGNYSLEFLIALSYLSLSAEGERPEDILSLYLQKY